ncbi:unnamed protein product, partial [Amoebophrya sp. A25]
VVSLAHLWFAHAMAFEDEEGKTPRTDEEAAACFSELETRGAFYVLEYLSHEVRELQESIASLERACKDDFPPPPPLPASSSATRKEDGDFVDQACDDHGSARRVRVPPPLSRGSIGHPHRCGWACRFAFKAGGCVYEANCTRCHLCAWSKKGKLLRAKKVRKEDLASRESLLQSSAVDDEEHLQEHDVEETDKEKTRDRSCLAQVRDLVRGVAQEFPIPGAAPHGSTTELQEDVDQGVTGGPRAADAGDEQPQATKTVTSAERSSGESGACSGAKASRPSDEVEERKTLSERQR